MPNIGFAKKGVRKIRDGQIRSDRLRRRYSVWPNIVPMLTRLNLDLDSALIQLPLPALCIRLPKQHNPLAFQWQDQPIEIRSILLSEINDGRGLSLLIDIGETMDNSLFQTPLFTYRNFPRREGLTVEQSLASLDRGVTADMDVMIPSALMDDCVRLSALGSRRVGRSPFRQLCNIQAAVRPKSTDV